MTERVLPPIGAGARLGPSSGASPTPTSAAVPGPATLPAAARPVAGGRAEPARRELILFTPARAGMLLGASAALYAVTLAGVSGLQAQADAAQLAATAPHLDAVARARAANDALESRIQAASSQLEELAQAYSTAGTDVEAFQARLDELAGLVSQVEGAAAALPARIKLPAVSVRAPSSSGSGHAAAPKTTARSRASGG